ncbi:EH signature domain-containing protein [Sulfurimonas sp.]|uniref:EH signature domain-containing protein n=1 Tax=Sulfurimonas sp. TaxID=2022749 RepID=UPI00260E7457|nr:EH signature domain-containing protein [Sulfurimonas sp.]MDD3854885.1 EH signature domain-containing protein [Sulfurimonas sp.]
MTDFVHSNVEFENNLFKKLSIEISKSTQRISYIADGGVNKGQIYQKAIKKFEEELEKGLGESSSFTWHEILYITNELAIRKTFFETLMEYEELETFILVIKKYQKLSIYKKLFSIYFNYYSTLNKANAMSVLKMYLKSVLRSYSGKNKYINNLVSAKEHIFGNLPDLLEQYNNDFEVIKRDMKLQDDFEFSKALLNLKIIQELKALDYDEDNQDVFSTILERKEMFFADGLTLKEYVAKYLISLAMSENLPFSNWQIFILKLIGDPRSTAMYTSTMGSWNIIGEERKEFFIKTLSKDDLKLFLEALSDSVSDTNYHYRKAFWMQFLEKVIFAKIMIGSDAYITMNDTMKEKFKFNNDSYGRLQGISNQSAVYIDFGSIKVIEYTHSGSVRGFSDCPIDLHQKHYSATELIALENKNTHLFTVKHASPRTYTWQVTVLEYLNSYLQTNVTKNDVEIPEDRGKREAYNKGRGDYI